jgi:prepilin-type N-terminal cleavage/methylation domain-containing protein
VLRRPDGQGGYSLVELLVAVTLFALVFAAVSLGMGRALEINRSNRNRSTAAYEAARQLEEARSVAAADFNNVALGRSECTYQTAPADCLPYSRPASPYTVRQEVSWVAPSSTSSSCSVPTGSSGTSLAYKRVTVTVTWPDMSGVAPVTSQTLLTPPIGAYDPSDGHVAVQLFDRNAAPLANQRVSLSGPASATQMSTEDGCAFFAYLDPGTYSLSLDTAGYVGRQGDQPAMQSNVAVQAAKITKVQMDYDRAATLQVTLVAPADAVIPAGIPITVANTGLTATAGKKIYPFAGNSRLRTVTPLFPYASGYEVWAGNCTDADPGTSARAILSSPPGATGAGTVDLATVNVTVRRGLLSQLLVSGAAVTVQAVHAADPTSCTSAQTLTATATTDGSGQFLLALPYGTWTIRVTSGTTGQAVVTPPLTPTSPNRNLTVTLL